MKKLFLIFILITLSLEAYSQKMEFFGQINEKEVLPVFNFSAHKMLNKKIGYSYFGLVNKNWGEAYFGPIFFPTEKMFFSLGIGIETKGNHVRLGSRCFYSFLGGNTFLLALEKGKGGKNYWYHVEISSKNFNRISIGLMARRFNGFGPKIKININKNFALWGSYLHDPEDQKKKGIISLSVNF